MNSQLKYLLWLVRAIWSTFGEIRTILSINKIPIILLISLMLASVIPAPVGAVPAAPIVYTLTQADGQTFQARQWGDEKLHGWETLQGYTIVFDEALKSWTYAVPAAGGELMSSGIEVKQNLPPPADLMSIEPHLRPAIQVEEYNLNTPTPEVSPKMRTTAETLAPVPPSTGTANIPLILVNFSNTSTTYNSTNFNNLLFGTGNYSMKDFYQEVSYGAFSVSAGPNGVVGWYKASNTYDYYGKNDAYGDDAWPGDLIYEAVKAADTAGFNFASYDRDGDCYVDVVMIVHQGTGEEAGGSSTDIWSHRWSLNYAKRWADLYGSGSHYGEYTTQSNCSRGGKIKVNDYTIQPEVLEGGIQTMGVFAHEYGHALGLPDLYDTDGSSEGIGNWSLMAGGSWNGVVKGGDRPAHIDPWCKYKLGWVAPTKVSATLTNEAITAANSAADVYQLLNGSPAAGGEYFLVENRQKAGFDAGLPGSGLLIWHIDEAASSNAKECYPGGPSCATQHYHVALVQADNLWELEKRINRGNAGDPYPGSSNKTAFSGSTSPNSNFYNGSPSNVSVTNISNSAATMTATLSRGGDMLYTLTVTKSGTGTGAVTSKDGGINCGSNCSKVYASGTEVTLTATPDSNSTFSLWSGGGCSPTGDCKVTMDQARQVNATFTALPAPSKTESLVIDFCPYGVWMLNSEKSWVKLHDLCTVQAVAADLDKNGQTDLVINFGNPYGVWVWLNHLTWVKLHGLSPVSITTADVDSNGQDDLVINFGKPYGIWMWMNNQSWVNLHGLSPVSITAADLDGNGKVDLAINFGPPYGLWVWMNNQSWRQLHSLSPTVVTAAYLDNNAQQDLVIDFAPYGIWKWMNNQSWVNLHYLPARSITAVYLDGNSLDDVVIDFYPYDIWRWMNNQSWAQLHSLSPTVVTAAYLDDNVQQDLAIDFAPYGIWQWMNNQTWVKLHNFPAKYITALPQ